MAWVLPITDWDGVTAGRKYLNAADFNRVDGNIDYLSDLIATFQAHPAISGIDTGNTNASIKFYDNINLIETNILTLATETYTPIVWTLPKTTWVGVIDPFDYTDQNRIENNLLNLKTMIDNIIAAFLKCGSAQAICGRGNTWL